MFSCAVCSGSGTHTRGNGGASGGSAAGASSLGAAGGNGGLTTIDLSGGTTTSPAAQTGNSQAVILASNQQYPAAIAVNGSNVYWLNLGTTTCDYKFRTPWIGGQVMKCATSGCQNTPTVLASDRVSDLNGTPLAAFSSDGVNVYWSDDTGATPNTAANSPRLFMCSVSGCKNSPQAIFEGSVSAIAVNSANLYWTTGTPVVDLCPVANFGAPMEFASLQDPNALSGALAADEDSVYWLIGDGEILQCAAGGCNGVPTVIGPNTPIEDVPPQIVLDTGNLYYKAIVDYATGSGEILACARTGCGDTAIVLASGLNYPVGIATDGLNVYWTEAGYTEVSGQQQTTPGVVRKCAVAGCNNLPTTVAGGLNNPQGIVVDEQNVYWTESGACPDFDGRIWRAPK